MTTNSIRQPHLHDLHSLKQRIKELAEDTRSQREAARALTGMDKHDAKEDAKANAEETRNLLLAYGYLRGRSIEQMESLYTRIDNLPHEANIRHHAFDYFMTGPEAEPWEEITKTETPIPDERTLVQKMKDKVSGTTVHLATVKVTKNDPPGWDEFAKRIAEDIKAWKAKVLLAHTNRSILRKTSPVQEQKVA